MKRWYNVELTKKDWELFQIFLKTEGYKYEASGIRKNWVHIEVFATAEDVEKMDKYLQLIDEYQEVK